MKRINSIEGLRTIGWVGMFLYYFKGAFLPNVHFWTDDTPLRFIYSGNAYIRLFFVISGFVISYKYFVKENYDLVFSDILKRYFRLMPPIVFTELLVFGLMSIGAMKNAEVSVIIGSEEFLGIFNQFTPDIIACLKEALATTYFSGTNAYVEPLWIITYEYLGALLILATINIFKKSPWRWLFYISSLTFFSSYFNYFIIGMLICDLYVNFNISLILKKYRIMHVAITISGYMMLGMVTINDADKYSRVIFGLGIVLFMVGMLSSSFLEKVLGNKIMIRGGNIAYSAYIIQWPIIESFTCNLFIRYYDKIQNYTVLTIILFIASLTLIIAMAVLMERIIEPIGISCALKIKDKSD